MKLRAALEITSVPNVVRSWTSLELDMVLQRVAEGAQELCGSERGLRGCEIAGWAFHRR